MLVLYLIARSCRKALPPTWNPALDGPEYQLGLSVFMAARNHRAPLGPLLVMCFMQERIYKRLHAAHCHTILNKVCTMSKQGNITQLDIILLLVLLLAQVRTSSSGKSNSGYYQYMYLIWVTYLLV